MIIQNKLLYVNDFGKMVLWDKDWLKPDEILMNENCEFE